jgi:hypothetical protein
MKLVWSKAGSSLRWGACHSFPGGGFQKSQANDIMGARKIGLLE